MVISTVPLKAVCILILSLAFTLNLNAKSVDSELPDSIATQLLNWEKQDSLMPWMAFYKSESQILRAQDDVAGSIDLLSVCINNSWRETKSEEEAILKGWIFVNRAYLYDQKHGNYLAAKSDYLNALELFETYAYNDFYVAAYLIRPLGNIYTRLGENEQAIGMLKEFQNICRKSNQPGELMTSYNDLGRAYMNNEEHEKAIELFNTGCLIDQSDVYNLGLIESSKAEAELYLGLYDQGISTAQLALGHLKSARLTMDVKDFRFEACNRYMTGAHTILGRLFLKTDDFEKSLIQFEMASAITEKFYQGKHRRKSKILIGLGDCYQEKKEYLKSIKYYQQALIESVYGFDQQNPQINPDDELLFADVVISEALTAKARISKKLYDKTKNEDWLQLSASTYLAYFRWNKKLRAEQLNIKSKLDLTTEIHKIAEETLEVIYLLENLGNNKDLTRTAFQIIEQTKGVILSESDISAFFETKNPELKKQKLDLDMLRMQKWLSQARLNSSEAAEDAESQENLKRSIEELDRKIQLRDFQLREAFPSYDKIRLNQNDSVNFSALQLHLKDRNCDLWSYFLGEEHLYLIKGTKEAFELKELDHELYQNLLMRFLLNLHSSNRTSAEFYERSAKELFNLLMPNSVQGQSENMLILPDGNMNLIPFEALVKKKSKGMPSYKNLHYVILDHTVYYAPSIKFVLQDRGAIKSEKTYLGFAPIFDQTNEFAHLPDSKDEVMFAKQLFSGEVFLSDSATKSEFIRIANQYELIHLSTHAGLGSGENNDGWIAFQNQKGIEKLRTPELLQLNLSAKLVVLNGCETGVGEIFKGEGTLSMARGFVQSGAQSVITNLWQVNHASNAQIMEMFYQELHETGSPAISLRRAKIAYFKNQLVDEQSAHPYYWAASVLIGTNNEISIPQNDYFISKLITIAGLTAILIAIIFFLRRKFSN